MAVYDGSEHSYSGVLLAAELASRNGVRLHVLSVVPLPKIGLDIATDSAIAASVDSRQQLMEALRADFASRGQQVHLALKVGNHVDEIVRYAIEYNVGQIVIGCTFKSWFDRLSAQAVLHRLIRLAPCPVTLVKKEVTRGSRFALG
ncbi:universal stress protein [Paraburkholderia rhizosphaerae]|nr:universal stress protein [Paraburkholderia rhizosphaerae]